MLRTLARVLGLLTAVLATQVQQSGLVQFELLPEPLYHFKVVLVLALGEFVDFDKLADAELLQRLLEELEVVNELVFVSSLVVEFGLGHLPRMQQVQHLAVGCSRAQLLYLVVAALEEDIDPVQQFAPGQL